MHDLNDPNIAQEWLHFLSKMDSRHTTDLTQLVHAFYHVTSFGPIISRRRLVLPPGE